MKKLLYIVLTFVLAINFAGCAAEKEAPAKLLSCVGLTRAVISDADALPVTTEVTDSEMLSDVLGYDEAIAEDMSVVIQLISVDLFELSVIRPAQGKSQEVSDMLSRRLSFLKEQAAYYPQQTEAASAALAGEYKGYHYLICSKDAQKLETMLREAIG